MLKASGENNLFDFLQAGSGDWTFCRSWKLAYWGAFQGASSYGSIRAYNHSRAVTYLQ